MNSAMIKLAKTNGFAFAALLAASFAGCGTHPRESAFSPGTVNGDGLADTELSELDANRWIDSLDSEDNFADQMATLALMVKSSNLSLRNLMNAKRFQAKCGERDFQRCSFSWEKEK